MKTNVLLFLFITIFGMEPRALAQGGNPAPILKITKVWTIFAYFEMMGKKCRYL